MPVKALKSTYSCSGIPENQKPLKSTVRASQIHGVEAFSSREKKICSWVLGQG
jgi:hypothetical protein